jgi:aspartyl-tRNA(Asn)/glutamyl-tRNA(Gln) amidotransferase subunit A
MNPDISNLSLTIARDQLRHREYSALELSEACLHQVALLNPTYQAFICPALEQAVQASMQADVLLNRQTFNPDGLPLLGIPIGVKDLINVGGIPTTAGSKFFASSIPAEDAPVVSKLKQSGGIILGKNNLHEIALGVTGVQTCALPILICWV